MGHPHGREHDSTPQSVGGGLLACQNGTSPNWIIVVVVVVVVVVRVVVVVLCVVVDTC